MKPIIMELPEAATIFPESANLEPLLAHQEFGVMKNKGSLGEIDTEAPYQKNMRLRPTGSPSVALRRAAFGCHYSRITSFC